MLSKKKPKSFTERLKEPVQVAQKRYGRRYSLITMPLVSIIFVYWTVEAFTSQGPNAKSDIFWYSPILIPLLIGGWWSFFKTIKDLPSKNCIGCSSRFYQGIDNCPDCGSSNFTNNEDTPSHCAKTDVFRFSIFIFITSIFFLASDYLAEEKLSTIAIQGAAGQGK